MMTCLLGTIDVLAQALPISWERLFYGLGIAASIAVVFHLACRYLRVPRHCPASGGMDLRASRTIPSFLAGFGWVGGMVMSSGTNLAFAALIATAAGVVSIVPLVAILSMDVRSD